MKIRFYGLNMNYKEADFRDIDLLVEERLKFIEVRESDEKYKEIKGNCYKYFKEAFKENNIDIILIEEDRKVIATGFIFYYQSVPSSFNVTGRNAYITNIYVDPNYRNKGIGSNIVKNLILKSLKRNFKVIMLNASEEGKKIYEKLGFKNINNSMIFNGNDV